MDPSPPEGRNTIDIKILSPSPEVGIRGLRLRDVAVNTTIRALKALISESIPSHPGPERQRLIYLGRALARDEDELMNVFGHDAIQNDGNHTLHLVLREALPSHYRPASVPPQSSNPFRTTINNPPASTGPTPVQRNPFASPQPAPPVDDQSTPLLPLPQPQAQPANPLAHIFANANIRASTNGVPINLPPEVINQLLNQRLTQEGTFNLMTNMQPRGPGPSQPQSQPTSAPASNPPSEGPSLPQQHWADHQRALAANFASGASMDRQASETASNLERQPPSDEAQPVAASPQRASISQDEPISRTATPAVPTPGTSGSPAINGPHQPQSHTFVRVGINPDGSRWQTTTVQYEGPLHHHHHPSQPPNYAPGQMPGQLPGQMLPGQIPNQLPGQLAQMPVQLPGHIGQLPLMQPLPRVPPQYPLPVMNPAMHLRMGTPPAGGPGLRPGTTPRSVSPARSVSDGPRRVGTPAAELQQRLSETMREVGNVNRLLGVMATGHLATGGPAQPLSEVEREQLRVTAHNMNQHISGFGADLATLINGHPNMRTDPDFAALNSLYQAVQAQGRAIRNQVATITANQTPSPYVGFRGGVDRNPELATELASNSEENSPSRNQTMAITPTPTTSQQGTPSAAPTSLPEVHVLNDVSGTPQALLVGPTGQFVSPALSPEVMNALMAARLPYEQLVQQFTQGVQQLITTTTPNAALTGNAQLLQALNAFALARQTGQAGSDDDAVIQRLTYILGQERGRRDARRRRRDATGANPPVAGGQNAAVAAVAAPGQVQQIADVPNRPQQVARGVNNEVRDILAPIVRNLWLAVRIAGFAYFFLASGRGYWRLLLLGGIALVIYALNSGWLGRNVDNAWEALQRHFETLVNDARRANPVAPTAAQAALANPTPEDVARRLMQEHQRRNRSATQEFINRAVARARQAERTFALFVASLWPGVGEGVIRAQEQARREEQERIEEAKKKREEEEVKKEEEEAKKLQKNAGEASSNAGEKTPVLAGTADQVNGVSEPKKRTIAVEDEGKASGSEMNGDVVRVNKGKAKVEDGDGVMG